MKNGFYSFFYLNHALLGSKGCISVLLLLILQGFLGDDEIPVFEIYLFSQDLDEDAPGSPGITDLPSAHRVLVDL